MTMFFSEGSVHLLMLHHKPLVCCQWYFESECWSRLGNYTKAEPDQTFFKNKLFFFTVCGVPDWCSACLPACLQVETLHSVHQPVMSLVRKLVSLSSFSTRAWSSLSQYSVTVFKPISGSIRFATHFSALDELLLHVRDHAWQWPCALQFCPATSTLYGCSSLV